MPAQISGLSRAYEVLGAESDIATKALKLAENSAAFIRTHLYNEQTGELRRSYREGQGPTGQADDYAFLIQGVSSMRGFVAETDACMSAGLLDLYEASAKEEYLVWAIDLQKKQDELFYDSEGGGYFASAPDPHILIRMKDAQVRKSSGDSRRSVADVSSRMVLSRARCRFRSRTCSGSHTLQKTSMRSTTRRHRA